MVSHASHTTALTPGADGDVVAGAFVHGDVASAVLAAATTSAGGDGVAAAATTTSAPSANSKRVHAHSAGRTRREHAARCEHLRSRSNVPVGAVRGGRSRIGQSECGNRGRRPRRTGDRHRLAARPALGGVNQSRLDQVVQAAAEPLGHLHRGSRTCCEQGHDGRRIALHTVHLSTGSVEHHRPVAQVLDPQTITKLNLHHVSSQHNC